MFHTDILAKISGVMSGSNPVILKELITLYDTQLKLAQQLLNKANSQITSLKNIFNLRFITVY